MTHTPEEMLQDLALEDRLIEFVQKASAYPGEPILSLFEEFLPDCAATPDLLKGLERAEQTIRNLGNGFLEGEARTIALNEAANLRKDIAKAKGQA